MGGIHAHRESASLRKYLYSISFVRYMLVARLVALALLRVAVHEGEHEKMPALGEHAYPYLKFVT